MMSVFFMFVVEDLDKISSTCVSTNIHNEVRFFSHKCPNDACTSHLRVLVDFNDLFVMFQNIHVHVYVYVN